MELHVCNQNGELLRAFAIGDSVEVIVGRDDTCDIRIASQTVSREHCSIERNGEELIVRDLNSTGGTYHNGQRVNQLTIEDGTEIAVGPAVLKFFDSGI